MTAVDVGVIQQFTAPPLGLLGPSLDTRGPFTGTQTFTDTSDLISLQGTFGVIAILNGAVLPNLGYNEGWTSGDTVFSGQQYEQMVFELVIQHQLFGGAWVTSQLEPSYYLANMVIWRVALPGRVGLYVLPGLAVDLYWLTVL